MNNNTKLSKGQILGITFLVIWLVIPMLPLFIWSFAKGWFFPQLIPEQWSLDAWKYVFSDTSQVLDTFVTSSLSSLTTAIISVIIGVPAGRALGLYTFRGKSLFELLVIAPTIVPGIAVVLGIHVIFIKLGLANTAFGVILVHLIPTLPYMILVMAGVFANYDINYEYQAKSLGASNFYVWKEIMLPAVLPGIMVGGMFAFIVSWSQYIMTLLIGGGKVISVPLLLFNFASAGRNDIAGAICILYIIPGIIIIAISAKYLKGISVMNNLSNP